MQLIKYPYLMKAYNIVFPLKKATQIHNTQGKNLLPQKSKVFEGKKVLWLP